MKTLIIVPLIILILFLWRIYRLDKQGLAYWWSGMFIGGLLGSTIFTGFGWMAHLAENKELQQEVSEMRELYIIVGCYHSNQIQDVIKLNHQIDELKFIDRTSFFSNFYDSDLDTLYRLPITNICKTNDR